MRFLSALEAIVCGQVYRYIERVRTGKTALAGLLPRARVEKAWAWEVGGGVGGGDI